MGVLGIGFLILEGLCKTTSRCISIVLLGQRHVSVPDIAFEGWWTVTIGGRQFTKHSCQLPVVF